MGMEADTRLLRLLCVLFLLATVTTTGITAAGRFTFTFKSLTLSPMNYCNGLIFQFGHIHCT